MEIAAWLACACFLVFLFNQLSRAWFTVRGKPTPLEQQAATIGIADRVTKIEQCIGNCKSEQDRRLDELEQGQKDLRNLISVENGKIYNRVNEAAEDTNVMRGELRGIKSNLDLLLSRSLGKR